MKVVIEISGHLDEDEVIIRCKEITPQIQAIQKAIAAQPESSPKLVFYSGNEEYYFTLKSIYFFETSADKVYAHTADSVYLVKLRLYELEKSLPLDFIRISKSTILNVRHILSIDRNITAASRIQFHKSHKQVYASRFYYKALRQRMEGIR